ncbi:hypothetical protein HDU76_013216 [Blyttiomyces sp. JEL0837]|nr:hypothetical protein HDU76_013216 [Blyttiomyces sp. JEL0837]
MVSIVKLGPIPKHVAFIMDGNRRFAKKKGFKLQKGHQEGFSKLEETLDWCLSLGVSTVTTYAFSTENFNRNPEEVRLLMELAREKFDEFATKSEIIEKHGIAVRIFGNTSLLPPEVQLAASRAVLMTRHNKRAVLNVCIPYTSREEMALAVKATVEGVERGELLSNDVNEELIEACLYSGDNPPLDILVRTSGEIRLSDFMLWQSSKDCHIHFIDAFWPDFTFYHMLPSLLDFQSRYHKLEKSRQDNRLAKNYILPSVYMNNQLDVGNDESLSLEMNARIQRVQGFLRGLRQRRMDEAVRLAVEEQEAKAKAN